MGVGPMRLYAAESFHLVHFIVRNSFPDLCDTDLKLLCDALCAVQQHAESHGYGVVRELVGHGVGTSMHEEPQVPNFGKAHTGVELRPGLVLAVEPMITQGTHEVEILKDGWTVVTADGKLAAHFEHTIAVTDGGPKILTLRNFGEHPDVAKYVPDIERSGAHA